MDGATFQIVLVDETRPQAQAPTRSELPPSPAPARSDPAPPTRHSAPPPTQTDRPASVAETRATPANGRADREHTEARRVEEIDGGRDRRELVSSVKEATKVVFDASRLQESLNPFFAAIAESQKVFHGVVAAAKLLTPARPNAPTTTQTPAPQPQAAKPEPPTLPPQPQAAKPEPPTLPPQPQATKPEPPDQDTLSADIPSPKSTQPPAAKVEPTPTLPPQPQATATKPPPKEIAVKPEPPKQTPEDKYLFGREERSTKPVESPKPQEPEKPKPQDLGFGSISQSISGAIGSAVSSVASLFSKRDSPKPEPTAAKTDDESGSRWDRLIDGISRLLDEPGVDASRDDQGSDEKQLAQIDRNTDPEHLETAADRIVRAIESVWAENEKTKQIAEQTGNANESLHDNTPSRIETPPAAQPASPIEHRPAPPSKQTPEDDFLFGRDDSQEQKPKADGDGGLQLPAPPSKAIDAVKAEITLPAGEAAGGAAVAEESAVAAAEGSAAMEAAATRAAQALARIGPALGPVAVAAGVVVGSLAAVAAAGFVVYKAFDAIGDAASKQADELAGYSADIAKQRSETDVRRQMRLIDRANERGETLARVGDAKDRLDEALNNLGDRVTDQFVDLADQLLPMVETLIGVINTTANFVDTIGTSCGVIEATVIDWLDLLGNEAEENKRWHEANEKHQKKVDKLMGRQDARERRKEEKEFKDPLLNLLHNAMGKQQFDPAVMQQLVAQVRNL